MRVTVIIAARPEQQEIKALAAARKLAHPRGELEIIVARGRHPSIQRNEAVQKATGEIIYFLDDDSVPSPSNLDACLVHFEDPQVKVVGGPNLCPPDSPSIEQIFGLTMGTFLAFGPSAARYRSFGIVRETSEKELILCNLLCRRDVLLQLGGFNPALYPNEENALMDQIKAGNGKLLHDPDLIVHRRPRADFKAFCKMLMTYGRGRAEQFRVNPTAGSILNFAPPLFILFLLLSPFLPWWLNFPWAIYIPAVVAEAFWVTRKRLKWFPHVAGLIVLSHLLYGAGFWKGLFTKLRTEKTAQDAGVKLEVIPLT